MDGIREGIVTMSGSMKVVLSIVAFACFGVLYGIALLTTRWSERYAVADAPGDDDD